MDRFPRVPCSCGKLIIAMCSCKPTQSLVAFDAAGAVNEIAASPAQYCKLIHVLDSTGAPNSV
jgi:hypothetical protein